MAKSKSTPTPVDDADETTSTRGKRKPREYRFEIVDSEGAVKMLPLTLTHKQSAKDVMAFLNEIVSPAMDGDKYRFTELIIHQ